MEELRTNATEAQAGARVAVAPEVASLTDMVRVMIEDRERREKEFAEERARREREVAEERQRRDQEREEERQRSDRQRAESEQRLTEMRRQMERLQEMFTEQTTAASSRSTRSTVEAIKVTRLTTEDDIESYLTTFERVMAANEVSRDRWSYQLAPYLTGKAQQAYAGLPPEEAKTYDTVKEAILRRYDINTETYRQRFRNLRPRENESPQEVVTRLRDLAARWGRDSSSREALLDLIVQEQFLAIMPDDVRIAVIERQPKDSGEAAQYAGNYLQARSMAIRKEKITPVNKCPRCGDYGHWASDCLKFRESEISELGQRSEQYQRQATTPTRGPRPMSRDSAAVRCYKCNERGHRAYQCPKRSSLFCERPGGSSTQAASQMAGKINGRPCTILLDTGTTQSLVHAKYVTSEDVLEESVSIRCIHGEIRDYPVAPIQVEIGGVKAIVKAAVSKKLPQSVVLGWDAPAILQQWLQHLNQDLEERVGIGPVSEPTTASPQEKEGGV